PRARLVSFSPSVSLLHGTRCLGRNKGVDTICTLGMNLNEREQDCSSHLHFLQMYPIIERSVRTRLALIICNTEFDSLSRRKGADVDIKDMKSLLESLGYRVDVKENLTASLGTPNCLLIGCPPGYNDGRPALCSVPELRTELVAIASRPEHQTSDSSFLIFLSHVSEGICGKKHSQEASDVLDVNTISEL
ncbi:Caspase-1, partial [Galemys pyrenaicus]